MFSWVHGAFRHGCSRNQHIWPGDGSAWELPGTLELSWTINKTPLKPPLLRVHFSTTMLWWHLTCTIRSWNVGSQQQARGEKEKGWQLKILTHLLRENKVLWDLKWSENVHLTFFQESCFSTFIYEAAIEKHLGTVSLAFCFCSTLCGDTTESLSFW